MVKWVSVLKEWLYDLVNLQVTTLTRTIKLFLNRIKRQQTIYVGYLPLSQLYQLQKNSNRGNVCPIHMSILVIILTDVAMHIREYKETETLYSSSTQSDTQLQRKTVFCQCSQSINKTFFEHSIYGAFLKLSHLSHIGSKTCEIVDLKTILNYAG